MILEKMAFGVINHVGRNKISKVVIYLIYFSVYFFIKKYLGVFFDKIELFLTENISAQFFSSFKDCFILFLIILIDSFLYFIIVKKLRWIHFVLYIICSSIRIIAGIFYLFFLVALPYMFNPNDIPPYLEILLIMLFTISNILVLEYVIPFLSFYIGKKYYRLKIKNKSQYR